MHAVVLEARTALLNKCMHRCIEMCRGCASMWLCASLCGAARRYVAYDVLSKVPTVLDESKVLPQTPNPKLASPN